MAHKGKKHDIRDYIRDAIKSGGIKRKRLPKKVNPPAKSRSPRAEFPKPMVEGQKRYPAYNVQPIRPRKKIRPPRQIADDAKRTMPSQKPKSFGIPKKKRVY